MERKEPLKDWEPERIRKAVTSKGVSIEELAEVWGVPRNSIYRCFSHPGYQNCEPFIAAYIGESVEVIFAARVAERKARAERKAKALLEARALVARQVA